MATITTNSYFDDAPRAKGEAFTINGAVFTIRTDTRVYDGAPAAMEGYIGATTISSTLGGSIVLDGRDVRWLAYDTGAGVVPAIGTTITQGAVSGYLLGVWADLNVAPTAVAAAMPTTGYLKFREVTGGAYAAGALAGISANATGADVTGWIEVVQQQSVANTVPRLGSFVGRGDWFYLGTTTGSAGQVIQVPTNGGGAASYGQSIEIETAPGSNEYEVYVAARIAQGFTTTNMSTDARCKFVCASETEGRIIIGSDGTSNIGHVPVAGCRIRMPNIIMRQSSAANGAINLIPSTTMSTRPDFTTTSGGVIDMDRCSMNWYLGLTGASSVTLLDCVIADALFLSNIGQPATIDGGGISCINNVSVIPVTISLCLSGGTIERFKIWRFPTASNGHVITLQTSASWTFDNCDFGLITYARSTSHINILLNIDTTIQNCRAFCCQINLTTETNFRLLNHDYTDRLTGTTNSTTGKSVVNCLSNTNEVFIDGITVGLNGTIANVHPYLAFLTTSNTLNVAIRNVGTAASPIVCGSNQPNYICNFGGNTVNAIAKRLYVNRARTGPILSVNTAKNILCESVHGFFGSQIAAMQEGLLKGLRAVSWSTSAQSLAYGTHWADVFTADLTGAVVALLNERTTNSGSQLQVTSGGATANGINAYSMPTVGDQVTMEMPYYCLGHTGFALIAPDLRGTNTGNLTMEYDLDVNDGNGFTGSYTALTDANLNAETISPTDGFKLRIRATTAVANTGNLLQRVLINTTTTLADQQAALYPLDVVNITLTGLVANSRVYVYDIDSDVEVYNEVVTGTSIAIPFTYLADTDIQVRVMYQSGATAKEFIEFEDTVLSTGFSRRIDQIDDAIYNLNAINGSTITTVSIDDTNLLVNVDTGSISWQEIYAYETYWLYTEEGIRDEGRFITAVDVANYILTDFKIKNVSSPSVPLEITDGYGVDSVTGKSIDLVDNTGGTIFNAPDHVVPYSTGGGGLTASDVWSYSTRALTTTGNSAVATAVVSDSKTLTVGKFLALK